MAHCGSWGKVPWGGPSTAPVSAPRSSRSGSASPAETARGAREQSVSLKVKTALNIQSQSQNCTKYPVSSQNCTKHPVSSQNCTMWRRRRNIQSQVKSALNIQSQVKSALNIQSQVKTALCGAENKHPVSKSKLHYVAQEKKHPVSSKNCTKQRRMINIQSQVKTALCDSREQ